jgi:hypothetical protein
MQIWSTSTQLGTLLVFLILSAPGTGAAMDQAKHDDIKMLVKELHELDDALKGFDASLKSRSSRSTTRTTQRMRSSNSWPSTAARSVRR